MDDVRVLCRECADTYRSIGYKLISTCNFKGKCDICARFGFEYKLKRTKTRGGELGK